MCWIQEVGIICSCMCLGILDPVISYHDLVGRVVIVL